MCAYKPCVLNKQTLWCVIPMVVGYTARDEDEEDEEGLHQNILQPLSVVFMSQLYAQQPSGVHHDMTTSLNLSHRWSTQS